MAYLSLYRRQRPLNFSGMTGQDHVARTLNHALSRGQLAHAYLFCGPRGTGKTTAAKILARAVNCRDYPAPEPCGECVSCRNILAGVSLDVIEMDAASNRGIEEIRELREHTRYASGENRYKVYIIDEAHMLTNEACNAFLKTLEEPPPGVIFILATTDPSRLPSTVVSRCQRFDFHLLTLPQISQRLKQVIKEEGWQSEEEALQLIARLAEGSMRDALGLLEQCRAYGEEMITADHVRTVTGATRSDVIGSLVKAIADEDLDSAIRVLQQITYGGRDLFLFLRDLVFIFSRLLLYSGTGIAPRTEEKYHGFEEILHQFGKRFSRSELLEIIELLHQVSGEMRHAHHPQFVLELALIRILRVLDRAEAQSAAEKASLHRLARPDFTATPSIRETISCSAESAAKDQPASAEATTSRFSECNKTEQKTYCHKAAEPADTDTKNHPGIIDKVVDDDLERLWPRILAEVKRGQSSTHDYLCMAQSRTLQGGLLELKYRKGVFAAERIGEKGHRLLVERTLQKFLARPVQLKVVTIDLEEKTSSLPDTVFPAQKTVGAPLTEISIEKNHNETEIDYDFDEVLELFQGKLINRDKEDNP